MKNKFLRFILAISILMSSANIGLANTDDVPDRSWVIESKEEITELIGDDLANFTLLSYIGVIRDGKEAFNGEDVVLKGYAAEVTALLATENLYTAHAAPYSDVLMTNKFVNGIYTAKSLGIIPDAKKFYPQKTATAIDVAGFVVKALGFKNYYPTYSTTEIIHNLELLNGINESKTEITKNELMKIIVNALNTNSVSRKYENGSWVIEVNEDESVLEKKEKISLIKGIVTDDGTASLFNENQTDNGKIEINRKVYDVNYRPEDNLTGKSIIAYADSENEDLIIYLTENDKLNNVIEVKYEDEVEFFEKKINYLNENGRRKKCDVDNGAKVIYNNLYAGSYSQFKFEKFNNALLIDNDNDDDIDVIQVFKYDYYFVDKIADYSKTISLYGSDEIITLSEEVCADIKIKLADTYEELTFSNIKQYDVLSVLSAEKSDGKKLYSIILSRKTVDGVFKGKDYVEEERYIIDGEKFILSDEYKKYLEENKSDPKPVMSEKYIFYLSHDGKIVMSKQDTDKYSYAYLLKVYNMEEEENVKIRVYTITGEMRDFIMSNKVKVFNEKNLAGKKIKKEEVYPELLVDNKIVNQMIAYKLDVSENIKEIALEYDLTGKQPGTIDYPIVRNAKVGGDGVKTEQGRLYEYVLGCGYYVPSRTTVLTVPSSPDKYDNILNFGLSQASVYGKDEYFDNNSLIVYNADKFYQAAFCITETAGGGINMDRFLRAYMLTGVSTTVNQDNEACVLLEYVDEDGLEQSAMVTTDARISTPDAGNFYGVHGGIEDLKKGDIVQMDITGAGVTGIRILVKSDNIGDYRTEYQSEATVTQGNGASPFSQLGIMYGEVKDVSTSALVMNVSPNGDEAFTHMVRLDNNTAYDSCTYTLFERKSGEVTSVGNSEIRKGDEIILRKRFHHATDLFIIR